MLKRIFVVTLCVTSVAIGQTGSSNGGRTAAIEITSVAGANTAAEANAQPFLQTTEKREFRLLATNKTSTMEKEMNEAANAGFRFEGTMGGETSFGGSEVVVIMSRDPSSPKERYRYRLLATSKTSTMQKELQQAGNGGFEYKGQSVYSSTFGGKEVVVILERDLEARLTQWEYRLLATKKTSTMQKELNEVGAEGFAFVGVTVGETAIGGREVVSILRRPASK